LIDNTNFEKTLRPGLYAGYCSSVLFKEKTFSLNPTKWHQ
jgi:hypothetical protein